MDNFICKILHVLITIIIIKIAVENRISVMKLYIALFYRIYRKIIIRKNH